MAIIVLLLLAACTKENEFSVMAIQKFYIMDTKGNDLLNPITENHINISRIKIYYLINGKKVEYSQYKQASDYPQGFYILSPKESIEKQYTIVLFLNDQIAKNNFSYTYIEFDDIRTDTIESIVKKKTNMFNCTMSSYNDSIWSPTTVNSIFTIIK